MIVVAIIGILAAVAIPQYQNYVARTQVAEALTLASGIKPALAEYYNTHGKFPETDSTPDNHDDLGIEAATDISGNYVFAVRVRSGGYMEIQFHNSDDTHGAIASTRFWMEPTKSDGAIYWSCTNIKPAQAHSNTNAPIDDKYLPSSCQ